MKWRRCACRRRGAAFMMVVVCLAVLSIVMVAIVWQAMANRRLVEHRRHKIQSNYLAHAGVELACARLLTKASDYTGETTHPIPDSEVRIEVHSDRQTPDIFRVTSTAHYPADWTNATVYVLSYVVRRITADSDVHLELKPVASPK